jgi:uncharacterized protein (DUF433 family)
LTLQITAEPLPLQEDVNGVVRVGGTRIPLDTVIAAYNMGSSVEEIVWQFPVLQLAEVHAVIGYYLRNQTIVDAYLRQRALAADQTRQEIESRQGSQNGLRERLLARRTAQQSP